MDCKLVTKPLEIASYMNRYFVDKVDNVRNGIQEFPPDISMCKRIMFGKRCCLPLSHISPNKVLKLLKNLKNSKSCSVYGFDNYSTKIASKVISKPLHHIIVLSIMQEKFPSAWKYAKIIPLHKKGSTLERKKYCPVALLSPLDKVVEKSIFGQLY